MAKWVSHFRRTIQMTSSNDTAPALSCLWKSLNRPPLEMLLAVLVTYGCCALSGWGMLLAHNPIEGMLACLLGWMVSSWPMMAAMGILNRGSPAMDWLWLPLRGMLSQWWWLATVITLLIVLWTGGLNVGSGGGHPSAHVLIIGILWMGGLLAMMSIIDPWHAVLRPARMTALHPLVSSLVVHGVDRRDAIAALQDTRRKHPERLDWTRSVGLPLFLVAFVLPFLAPLVALVLAGLWRVRAREFMDTTFESTAEKGL